MDGGLRKSISSANEPEEESSRTLDELNKLSSWATDCFDLIVADEAHKLKKYMTDTAWSILKMDSVGKFS